MRDGPGRGPGLEALLGALLRSCVLLGSLLRSRVVLDCSKRSRVMVLELALNTLSGVAGADNLRRTNRLLLGVSSTTGLASEYVVVGVTDMLSLDE